MSDHRNPSPPPDNECDREAGSSLQIGSSVFRQTTILETVLKLTNLVEEEADKADAKVSELDEETEDELCRLWDMTVDKDVVLFLHNTEGFSGLLCSAASLTTKPRLTEIGVGIMVNMLTSSNEDVARNMAQDSTIMITLLYLLEQPDAPTLIQVFSALKAIVQLRLWSASWSDEFERNSSAEAVLQVMKNTTNGWASWYCKEHINKFIEPLLNVCLDFTSEWLSELDDSIEQLIKDPDELMSSLGAALDDIVDKHRHGGASLLYVLHNCTTNVNAASALATADTVFLTNMLSVFEINEDDTDIGSVYVQLMLTMLPHWHKTQAWNTTVHGSKAVHLVDTFKQNINKTNAKTPTISEDLLRLKSILTEYSNGDNNK